jgi:phage gp45-like
VRHQSTRHASERVGNSISRTIVEQVDDTKLMQFHNLSGYAGEKQQDIEHVHPYGFTSVVKPPSGGSGGQGGAGGVGSAGGNSNQREGAEGFMGFMGGGRSHGVVFVAGDRRYRLYKLQDGEVALHDDQGQQLHVKRDGIWASVPNSKKVTIQVMDDDSMPQDSGGGSSSGSSQKLGQIQQAGRAAQISLVIDKTHFTLNHPNGDVVLNCKTFTVNASSDAKMISGSNALVKGANAILYGSSDVYISAIGTVNVLSPINLVSPTWTTPANPPPITS